MLENGLNGSRDSEMLPKFDPFEINLEFEPKFHKFEINTFLSPCSFILEEMYDRRENIQQRFFVTSDRNSS